MSELIRSLAKSPYRPGGPYNPPVQPMTFPEDPLTFPEDQPAPIQFPEQGKVPFVNPFDSSQVQMIDAPDPNAAKRAAVQKKIQARALAQQSARRK